ncbi:YhbY family RNA-binding protein [Spirochaeta dissipatitropha]
MSEITSSQRKYLSKQAHNLEPVVMVGRKGFTEEIIEAVNQALESHELIKVRFVDFKAERALISEQLAVKNNASLVRIIGNTAILYRECENTEKRRYRLPSK